MQPKVRVLILTGSRTGLASLALPRLAEEQGIDVAMVVLSQGAVPNPWRERRRKLRKVLKIGPFGAINGMRMRRWFTDEIARRLRIPAIEAVAQSLEVHLERTPATNSPRTVELFRKASADLGLSLGNSYISPRVFTIPDQGMINVHHEILPEFRGAQSVIWQIHEGLRETGYTIHQIDRDIDTGSILLQRRMPIEWMPTLAETVSHNYARLYTASAEGLVSVVKDYAAIAAGAKPQGRGRTYTTPTLTQYLKMLRQHRRLSQKAKS